MGDQGGLFGQDIAGLDFQVSGIRFPCPKPFNGEEKNFEEFNTKLKSYLSNPDPDFREIIRAAQEEADPID